MSASDAASDITAPFGPPDCPWIKISSNTSIPETAVYQDGKLDGEKVYIGRVYDGKCVYVGTAIPEKGVCIYVDKNLSLKNSKDYEILTVDCGDPLTFEDMDLLNKNLLFNAGADEDGDILYVGRHVDSNGNTYYGWVSKKSKSVCIPRDSNQVLDKNFGVMIHNYLDRLCICPPCPF